jgi:ribosome biogenesis GTPase A
MNYTLETGSFLNDLDRVARTRQEIANHFNRIVETITQSEFEGDKASGKLGLEKDSEDISIASQNLQQGVFRLLVLGDLKRGKSTFLNALIGRKLIA